MKTTIGIMMIIASIALFINLIVLDIRSTYKYNKEIGSYWELAEKASTIEKKSEYIDLFVEGLDKAKYYDQYNAVIFTTPDNSFNENLTALKSFQNRLHEIKGMSVSSFEYQTAIQQITAQEQGEGYAMTNTLQSIWFKINYPLLWNWWGVIHFCLILSLGISGYFVLESDDY